MQDQVIIWAPPPKASEHVYPSPKEPYPQLTGHPPVLQGCDSEPCPTQSAPPSVGVGLLHDLVLVWVPPPQDSEQVDQSPKLLHPPSTGVEHEYPHFVSFFWIFVHFLIVFLSSKLMSALGQLSIDVSNPFARHLVNLFTWLFLHLFCLLTEWTTRKAEREKSTNLFMVPGEYLQSDQNDDMIATMLMCWFLSASMGRCHWMAFYF